MSLLRTARLFNIVSRGFSMTPRRLMFNEPEELPAPEKIMTGLEKRVHEAVLAGDEDPFGVDGICRGIGTKEKPTLIPSAFDSRIVGCICDDENCYINYMWLHKGTPKRCMCGHWYQLIYKAPV